MKCICGQFVLLKTTIWHHRIRIFLNTSKCIFYFSNVLQISFRILWERFSEMNVDFQKMLFSDASLFANMGLFRQFSDMWVEVNK
jgi:hypothetical protein